jgi:glycosyltransferase involved in cell wall biosynthesis
LATLYGLTNTAYVPNGIDLARFAGPGKKVPFRCVYASSPDRGLETLLRLWPGIVEQEPTAELHIAYGWDNIDPWIARGDARLYELKQTITALIERTPRVVWRGRLPQDQLARLYQESYCWLYPSSFTEVSCISAMEAMAGGAVPVTSAVGALPETIGDAGIVVTGNTYTEAWREFWLSCAKGVLFAPDVRLPLAAKGVERAKGLTWNRSFEKWKEIVSGLLEGSKEAVMA